MKHKNLGQLFLSTVNEHSLEKAIYYKQREDRKNEDPFLELTWKEIKEKVFVLATFLLKSGFKKGDRVAIFSNTRLEWMLSDLATIILGGVTVAFYHTCSVEELGILLNDAKPTFVFIEDHRLFKRFLETDYRSVDKVILFEDYVEETQTFTAFNEVLKTLNNLENEILKIIEQTLPDDLATVVYTSGTSGDLKGAMLTNKNILTQMESIPVSIPIDKKQGDYCLLAFLTTAHIFQRIAGQWYFISQGRPMVYCNKIELVPAYLKNSPANIMLAVPLMLDKIKSKVEAKISELEDSKKETVKRVFSISKAWKSYELNISNSYLRKFLHKIHSLTFAKLLKPIKDQISPSLKAVVSGGAPISEDTLLFFHALGIYLIEGYGLTETSGILTANSPFFIKKCSIGKALNGVKLRIAEDGEIQASGEVIFQGYLNKPDATAETFTEDGWFKTGDIGSIDSKGFLQITGRKKDIIVTAGGKKVSPALIEQKFKASSFIDQTAIFGDKQKWIVALITLHQEAVEKLFQDLGKCSWHELIETPEVKKLIDTEINSLSEGLAEYEKIRKYKILPEPFSQNKGELTHTMKIKRKTIEANYGHEIEKLYSV
jgi:long-chain acyl-CoA synthetase